MEFILLNGKLIWFIYLVWSLDLREIMKYVKLNVLLVFLILIIMSVGMVSAAENVSMDSDVNNDVQKKKILLAAS